MNERQLRALETIRKVSDETGVSYDWMVTIASAESKLGIDTVQHLQNGDADFGLFQIMPSTWPGLQPDKAYSSNDYDQAIAGAKYIKQLAKKYDNNFELIAIAYNKGPGVANYFKNGVPFTKENVRKAVYRIWPGDESKVKELFEYKALNNNFTPTSVTNNSNDVGTTREANITNNYLASEPQFSDLRYDSQKSFLSNLGSSKDVQRITAMAKLAMVTNSGDLLRQRIAKSKLAPILRGKA